MKEIIQGAFAPVGCIKVARQLEPRDDVAGRLLARLGFPGGAIDAGSVKFAPVRLLFLLAFSEDLDCSAIRVVDARSFAFPEGSRRRHLSEHFDYGSVVVTFAMFAFSEPDLTAASVFAVP